jgi:hypothetical protein
MSVAYQQKVITILSYKVPPLVSDAKWFPTNHLQVVYCTWILVYGENWSIVYWMVRVYNMFLNCI